MSTRNNVRCVLEANPVTQLPFNRHLGDDHAEHYGPGGAM